MSNTRRKRRRCASESALRNFAVQYSAVSRSRLLHGSLVLKWIKRSVIIIGRSMFDVRCSIFSMSGQAELHTMKKGSKVQG